MKCRNCNNHIVIIFTIACIFFTTTSTIDAFHIPKSTQLNVHQKNIQQDIAIVSTASPVDGTATKQSNKSFVMMTSTFLSTATLLLPVIARAIVEDDNYEYGAVDAPIGIAVGGGLLAILTALLPIALKGGEEAFEEIKDRDADTFGKRNTDLLSKKKK